MNLQAHLHETWTYLHGIPEPAFQEKRTSAYLAEQLKAAGYSVSEGLGGTTGLFALLDSGKPGPTVALRTDMDCLLFKQVDGSLKAIHACGHDAHMSIALGVAKLLAEQPLACGRVKILCQPAEEIGKGALALLEAGALDDVDYVLGYHVMPRNLAQAGQIISQINWTACTLIEAEIKGLAAHGSQPHLGINAIDVGASIVAAVNALHTDPLLGGNVKVTRFLGGSGSLNAICDKVTLGFDLRSTSNAEMLKLRAQVQDIIAATAKVYGATATSHIVGTCPAAEADLSLQKLTQSVITQVLGPQGLLPATSLTIGEDFNFFKQERPQLKTASLGLGCNLAPGLHDPEMHFELSSLEGPILVLERLMREILLQQP